VFENRPIEPVERKGYGHIKFLISYQTASNIKINQGILDEIAAMKSYLGLEMFIKVGRGLSIC
jgi:hypothetical protein